MAQCKVLSCKRPALPIGKRYCLQHKERYLRKRVAQAEKAARADKCVQCGTPIWVEGETLCKEHREVENRRAERARAYDEFYQLGDWVGLKDWIGTWVVPGILDKEFDEYD